MNEKKAVTSRVRLSRETKAVLIKAKRKKGVKKIGKENDGRRDKIFIERKERRWSEEKWKLKKRRKEARGKVGGEERMQRNEMKNGMKREKRRNTKEKKY